MTDEELKRLFAEHSAENQRRFDQTATRLSAENRQAFETTAEDLRHQIQQVAEGVTDTREILAREAADVRQEMRQGFAETQAMIKFSHSELDRRVRTLEDAQRATNETLAEVQARLDRLESSTH